MNKTRLNRRYRSTKSSRVAWIDIHEVLRSSTKPIHGSVMIPTKQGSAPRMHSTSCNQGHLTVALRQYNAQACHLRIVIGFFSAHRSTGAHFCTYPVYCARALSNAHPHTAYDTYRDSGQVALDLATIRTIILTRVWRHWITCTL